MKIFNNIQVIKHVTCTKSQMGNANSCFLGIGESYASVSIYRDSIYMLKKMLFP
ncbi:hypothetical protein APHCR_0106 [Anaplasma phagocytophilum str. CR1007]|nr:hypothetical protein APHCR_0106 [Anaplasma phagocytophilum str. CR1007]